MSASKIVDEDEVRRWFHEGRTYKWMTEEYKRKYNLTVAPSVWGMFRRRKNLPRRISRNTDLIPWSIKLEHRRAYPISRLRSEARRREGRPLTEQQENLLESWLAGLKRDNVVVHYDPNTEQGFFYVNPRPGIDTDLIRVPDEDDDVRRDT